MKPLPKQVIETRRRACIARLATSRLILIANTVIIFLLQVSILPFAPAQSHDGKAVDRQAIQDVVHSFVSAWNRSDAQAVAQLFSRDGTFVSPSGSKADSRAEIIKLLKKEHEETFKGTTLSMSIGAIQSAKDDVAVVDGTYELSGVDLFLGLTTTVTGPFIFRLAKQDGRWTIEQAQVKR
jgi:uncharacterized protein (TIGR02246 family)